MPERASLRSTASEWPACAPSATSTSIAQFSWMAPPPSRFRTATVALLAPAALAMNAATACDCAARLTRSAPLPEVAAVIHEVLRQQHLVHFRRAIDQFRLRGVAVHPFQER